MAKVSFLKNNIKPIVERINEATTIEDLKLLLLEIVGGQSGDDINSKNKKECD